MLTIKHLVGGGALSAERVKPIQAVRPKFQMRTKSWINMIDITSEPFYMDKTNTNLYAME